MIEPYTAVGLIPTFWGARSRDDIKKNLDHLGHLTKAATMLSNLEDSGSADRNSRGRIAGIQRRGDGCGPRRVRQNLCD